MLYLSKASFLYALTPITELRLNLLFFLQKVQAGDVDMAIGGDQGGSIRIPSSICGIVGLKPTWGLVPYTGAVSIETTIDHLGPMARTVEDCALLLEVSLAGMTQ